MESLLTDMQARFGADALRPLKTLAAPATLTTTRPALDNVLGMGGLPRGHRTAFCSAGTTGARTLAYRIAARAQADGDRAAVIDPTFDPDYAARCGVSLKTLVCVPSSRDPAEAVAELVPYVGVMLVESVVALPSQVRAALRGSACALVSLGADAPEDASLVLRFTHRAWLWRGRDVCGYRSCVTVVKNRFAPHGRGVEVTFEGLVGEP